MSATAHGAAPYYFVPQPSHWPMVGSIALLAFGLGMAGTINGVPFAPYVLAFGFAVLFYMMYGWFATVARESESGQYNERVDVSFRWSMSWFIFSEVMFFSAFFGALFYVRFFVVPWLGGEGDHGLANRLWQGFQATWPPAQTPQEAVEAAGGAQLMAKQAQYAAPAHVVGWMGIPLLNTILLVTSSVTVHFAHTALKANKRSALNLWLAVTLILGFVFVGFQAYEYHHAYTELGLTLASGIYGSTFFLLTVSTVSTCAWVR